jgi:hypothetical protein
VVNFTFREIEGASGRRVDSLQYFVKAVLLLLPFGPFALLNHPDSQ